MEKSPKSTAKKRTKEQLEKTRTVAKDWSFPMSKHKPIVRCEAICMGAYKQARSENMFDIDVAKNTLRTAFPGIPENNINEILRREATIEGFKGLCLQSFLQNLWRKKVSKI